MRNTTTRLRDFVIAAVSTGALAVAFLAGSAAAVAAPVPPNRPPVTESSAGQTLSDELDALPNARNSEAQLQPNTIRLLRLIEKTFPYYATDGAIGGWRPDAIPDHPSGQALDIMINGGAHSKADVAQGNLIAAFLMANSRELGVTNLIWRGHIWEPSRGWNPIGDRHDWTGNHMDHVHVLVAGSHQPAGKLIEPADIQTAGSMPTSADIRNAVAARLVTLTRETAAAKESLTSARAELARVDIENGQRSLGVDDSQRRSDSMAREAYMFGADLELASAAIGLFSEPETIGMMTMVTDRENQSRRDEFQAAKGGLEVAQGQLAAARATLEAAEANYLAARQNLKQARD